jgi:GT2 family glycosyltransferase
MAVPREAAEAVRARDGFLFRESLDVHQDVDLSERIRRTGRAVVHAPGWIVHHRRETTLRSCLARNRRMARAGRRHGLQRRAHAGLACGLVFGLVLVALAVLSPASRPFVLGLAGLAVVGPFVDAWFRTRRLTAALWAPVLLHGIAVARAVGHVRG